MVEWNGGTGFAGVRILFARATANVLVRGTARVQLSIVKRARRRKLNVACQLLFHVALQNATDDFLVTRVHVDYLRDVDWWGQDSGRYQVACRAFRQYDD